MKGEKHVAQPDTVDASPLAISEQWDTMTFIFKGKVDQ